MSVGRPHHLRADGAAPDRGLGLAVLSAAAFGTSGTFATSLLRIGWTPAAAVALRLTLAALALSVVTIPLLRGSSRRGAVRPGSVRQAWPTLVLYGLVPVASCQLCYFEAVQHLSVAVALLLEYSGALLVVAWMWARHHQVPSRVTAAGGVAAVAGLVMVLNLVGQHHLSPVGVLWGLGAAVGLAVYFVVSARAGDDHLPPLLVAWGGLSVGAAAMWLVGLVGLMPLRAARAQVVLAHLRVSWWVPLLGIGLVAAAFAYVTGIAAARALGPRLASFVGLAEVLFATVYAWILLGQRLSPTQLVGAALVVAGITLVRLGEPAGPESVAAAGSIELAASPPAGAGSIPLAGSPPPGPGFRGRRAGAAICTQSVQPA